jgi:hypothetical protein
MRNINFTTTREDAEIITAIVSRAVKEDSRLDPTTLMMDLSAANANDCGLRLADFLAAPDYDFLHDVYGIYRHMNRETGKLEGCFIPRYIKKEEEI